MNDATNITNRYRSHLRMRLVECGIPRGLHAGLVEYIAARRPTGDFLRAVLSNDLKDACGRAAPANRRHLCGLVFFLFNYAPAPCWGSPEAVTAWLADPEDAPLLFE